MLKKIQLALKHLKPNIIRGITAFSISLVYITSISFYSFAEVTVPLNETQAFTNTKENNDPHDVWKQIDGLTAQFPDEVAKPDGTRETDASTPKLKEGDTFEVKVNGPKKIVCGNNWTHTQIVEVRVNGEFSGNTKVSKVGQKIDSAKGLMIIEMKVDKIDNKNPDLRLEVLVYYEVSNSTTGKVKSKDLVATTELDLLIQGSRKLIGIEGEFEFELEEQEENKKPEDYVIASVEMGIETERPIKENDENSYSEDDEESFLESSVDMEALFNKNNSNTNDKDSNINENDSEIESSLDLGMEIDKNNQSETDIGNTSDDGITTEENQEYHDSIDTTDSEDVPTDSAISEDNIATPATGDNDTVNENDEANNPTNTSKSNPSSETMSLYALFAMLMGIILFIIKSLFR